jgi:hypothetical protein
MLTRLATAAIVTAQKTLTLPPPNAMGFRLTPASASNKGNYPLKAIINNEPDRPTVITGPEVYFHEEPILKLEVDASLGGGAAGDVWHLDVEASASGTAPYPRTDSEGYSIVSPRPVKTLAEARFSYSDGVFVPTAVARRAYVTPAGTVVPDTNYGGDALWDWREFRTVEVSYEHDASIPGFYMDGYGFGQLGVFVGVWAGSGHHGELFNIPMGTANNFAGGGYTSGVITLGAAPEQAARYRATAKRPLYGTIFFEYTAAEIPSSAVDVAPIITVTGHY